MAKKRVHEIAKELGLPTKEVVERLQGFGYAVKTHSSSLEGVDVETAMSRLKNGSTPEKKVVEAESTVAPVGVVRRRRKTTESGNNVVTTTQIVPGQSMENEVALSESTTPVVEEPTEAELEERREAEAYEEEAEEPRYYAEGEEEQSPVSEGQEVQAGSDGSAPDAAPGETSALGVTEGAVSNIEHKLSEPTATQAVLVSRPLIAIAPKIPPGPRGTTTAARRIGPVKEFQVVTDSLGRGKEFVDVTKDKAGKKKTPGGARRAKEAFSKRELLTMARERAYIPVRGRKKRATKKGKRTEVTVTAEHKRVIRIQETIQVHDLAAQMGARLNDVIRKLMQMGTPAAATASIDLDTATLVAAEFDYRVERYGLLLEDIIEQVETDVETDLVPRPPIITVMGHVDHGKTSLLDFIRKSRVTAGEAGGITQHMGAYSVKSGEGSITFIDTPGHEAFTQMRARGAEVTDIVILVVAADDSIMPQTVEAINHAKAAKVPMIVAVNKCDLPQANPERVRQNLTEHQLVAEEWGGDTIVVDISAKTGKGVDKLLEMVLLQSEVLELRANPKMAGEGTVVEARLERGRGAVATVLVKHGTLRKGDIIYSGSSYGKIKVLTDDTGKQVKEIGPGFPAEIQGLDAVPEAGAAVYVVKDEKAARELASRSTQKVRVAGLAGDAKIASPGGTVEEILAQMKGAEAAEATKELQLVVKSDVQGTLEAVCGTLEKQSTERVRVRIIHRGVGMVSESDVMLANAAGGMIVGFNVKADPKARKSADHEGVEVRSYSVIYNAVDDIKTAMAGLLPPIRKETQVGRAEVVNVFRISGKGAIAGCSVVEGKMVRSARIRVMRANVEVFEGKFEGLKRFKDDVREVPSGMECGISIANFNDVQSGDVLVAFSVEEIRATL